MAGRSCTTGFRNQACFLLAIQLPPLARTWAVIQGSRQTAFDKPFPDALDTRAANVQRRHDFGIRQTRIGFE